MFILHGGRYVWIWEGNFNFDLNTNTNYASLKRETKRPARLP